MAEQLTRKKAKSENKTLAPSLPGFIQAKNEASLALEYSISSMSAVVQAIATVWVALT